MNKRAFALIMAALDRLGPKATYICMIVIEHGEVSSGEIKKLAMGWIGRREIQRILKDLQDKSVINPSTTKPGPRKYRPSKHLACFFGPKKQAKRKPRKPPNPEPSEPKKIPVEYGEWVDPIAFSFVNLEASKN